MTKEEAEKQVAELNKRDFTNVFCPLTNGNCRTACVCFVYAGLVEIATNDYSVRSGYCNNAMFYKEYNLCVTNH